MNIMSIHIDETLDDRNISRLRQDLFDLPHVFNVEIKSAIPHDLVVEYEEHHYMPVIILDKLAKQGLHTDIQYC